MLKSKSDAASIARYSLTGELLSIYSCVSEAAKSVEVTYIQSISKSAGTGDKAHGYLWRRDSDGNFPVCLEVPHSEKKWGKAVIATDKDGVERSYSSLTDAAAAENTNACNINACIRGTQKTANGLSWRLATGAHVGKKKIIAFNSCGERVGEYKTQAEIVRSLGVKATGVVKCLKGKQKEHLGYRFEYI
jgi:hypothetical protein